MINLTSQERSLLHDVAGLLVSFWYLRYAQKDQYLVTQLTTDSILNTVLHSGVGHSEEFAFAVWYAAVEIEESSDLITLMNSMMISNHLGVNLLGQEIKNKLRERKIW